MVDSYNDLSSRLAGNEPPAFFKVKNVEDANKITFSATDFTALMPTVKERDFTIRGGWHASFHGKDISTLYLDDDTGLTYHIEFYSSIYKYGNSEKALENGDEEFFKKKEDEYFQREKTAYLKEEKERIKYKRNFNSRSGNYEILTTPIHIEHHGQENYQCLVNETIRLYTSAHNKYYNCYKFNQKRTMVKEIGIRLIYTHSQVRDICPQFLKKQCDPNNTIYNAKQLCEQAKQTCSEKNIQKIEQLSKEYIYEDLQERAKRILDTLYIKDGWDK